ncbi:MAG: protoheme IX farnesyltransferase [Micavibrio aeruginosavorus]|uniref:Protoheme IX farnesyltransferase n=1 Tax=Micavibrio aeruginosavorus TaxID=349221 RepID=A0A2W5A3H1_9BACT|nr:MAG: protoheme IX farnesyltransferase [Micavibrio aeruginosavorus]
MSDTAIMPETSEATVGDYFALLKPKVMSLVVFTGFAGMWVAPGFADLHPVIAATAVLCIALGAGAAGAINMWYDRDIDAVMNRTKNRPIPAGRVNADEALSFGVILSLLSVMTMGVAVNWMAAALLAIANLFYVFVYTIWLKRRTPQNIVIGGAAGAFPPMIGWAAVTGDITLASVILFCIIFFWTPPHFWALSLFANEDYKRANVPMLPVVSGERTTKIQMMAYTLLMIPLSVAPYILDVAGIGYGIFAFALSVFFLYTNFRVLVDTTHRSAKLMFGYSVFYLFALFAALMIDKV